MAGETTDRERIARAEIARIGAVPLRDRTEEDNRLMEINLLRRDFAVMDRERAEHERGVDLACARILRGFWS